MCLELIPDFGKNSIVGHNPDGIHANIIRSDRTGGPDEASIQFYNKRS
jgi:hypothetical protein